MVGRLEGERDWDGRKAADPTPQPPLARYTALKLDGGERGTLNARQRRIRAERCQSDLALHSPGFNELRRRLASAALRTLTNRQGSLNQGTGKSVPSD